MHTALTKIGNLEISVFVEQQIFWLLWFRQIPTSKQSRMVNAAPVRYDCCMATQANTEQDNAVVSKLHLDLTFRLRWTTLRPWQYVSPSMSWLMYLRASISVNLPSLVEWWNCGNVMPCTMAFATSICLFVWFLWRARLLKPAPSRWIYEYYFWALLLPAVCVVIFLKSVCAHPCAMRTSTFFCFLFVGAKISNLKATLTETTWGWSSNFIIAISRLKRSPRVGSTIAVLSITFIAIFFFVGRWIASRTSPTSPLPITRPTSYGPTVLIDICQKQGLFI